MAIHVEFAGGGPADGTLRDFPQDIPEIRIYTPRAEVGFFTEPDEAVDKSPARTADTHIYRRQSRITVKGYRIFLYAGKLRG